MQLSPLGQADQSPPQHGFLQICSAQNKPRAQSLELVQACPSAFAPAGAQLGLTDEPFSVGKHDSPAPQPDCV